MNLVEETEELDIQQLQIIQLLGKTEKLKIFVRHHIKNLCKLKSVQLLQI